MRLNPSLPSPSKSSASFHSVRTKACQAPSGSHIQQDSVGASWFWESVKWKSMHLLCFLEALGAVPDLCEGVMYYKALNTTSPLFLSQCGHLAIRIDEWPSFPFEWPQLPQSDQLPDAWAPDGFPLKPVRLPRAHRPSRSPPHAVAATVSEHCTTFGTAAMATDVEPIAGVHLHDQADGSQLRSHQYEALHEGSHSGSLVSAPDGNNNAELYHSVAAEEQSPEEPLPEGSCKVHASTGRAKLWSGWTQNDYLRPVWHALGRAPSDGSSGTMPTKSLPNSSDSSRGPKGSTRPSLQGQSQEQTHQGHLGKLLSRLGAMALATSAALHLTGNTAQVERSSSSTYAATGYLPSDYDLASHDEWQSGQHECGFQLGGPNSEVAPGEGPLPGGGGLPLRHDSRGGRVRGHVLRQFGPAGGGLPRPGQLLPGRLSGRTTGGGRRGERTSLSMSPIRIFQSSADDPLLPEDCGAHQLRSGTQKRLLGTAKDIYQAYKLENDIYTNRSYEARRLRQHYGCDLCEVYGGYANITAEALHQGLRAVQPVDAVHGIQLQTKEDHELLRAGALFVSEPKHLRYPDRPRW